MEASAAVPCRNRGRPAVGRHMPRAYGTGSQSFVGIAAGGNGQFQCGTCHNQPGAHLRPGWRDGAECDPRPGQRCEQRQKMGFKIKAEKAAPASWAKGLAYFRRLSCSPAGQVELLCVHDLGGHTAFFLRPSLAKEKTPSFGCVPIRQ